MDLRKKPVRTTESPLTPLAPFDTETEKGPEIRLPVVVEAAPSPFAQLNALTSEVALLAAARDLPAIARLVERKLSDWISAESVGVSFTRDENSSAVPAKTERDFPVRVGKRELAIIRYGEKRDWTAYSPEDFAILSAVGTQLALVLENHRLECELERHQASSVQALAAAIEVKDRYTAGHTKRVGVYSDVLSEYLSVADTEKEKIRLAGVLHDIGKIGVPDRILLKPESLTGSEWEEMRLHTEAGFDIVSRVAGLEEIAEILRHHHERWNGTGYPRGLRAEEIPFASRVISVADTFDAIVTDRPYRPAMAPERAYEIIVELSGIHFDPVVVTAFQTAFSRLRACALEPVTD